MPAWASQANCRSKRAQAPLWLHQGERITTVAQRLGLTRSGIYNIVKRYQAHQGEPVEQRVKDRPYPGRPATKREQTMEVIAELLEHPPQCFGYRQWVWTTPLLQAQAQQQLKQRVSRPTVRRALHALRHRYKRPRYVLARRSPTGRQARGITGAYPVSSHPLLLQQTSRWAMPLRVFQRQEDEAGFAPKQ